MLVLTQALWGVYRPPGRLDGALPLEVELEAEYAERLFAGVPLRVWGRVSARALGESREAFGVLALGGGGALLRYDLEFGAARGPWRLVAALKLDWRRPLLSLSTLQGSLNTGSARYEVELRYDYRRDLRGLLRWE